MIERLGKGLLVLILLALFVPALLAGLGLWPGLEESTEPIPWAEVTLP